VILGFILAIYIVASKESLSKMIKGLLYSISSKEKADNVISVSRLSKKAFEGFICGQCIEVVLIGTLTFIGMCIFKFCGNRKGSKSM
jgi:predicted PurR-regulated permease PerM